MHKKMILMIFILAVASTAATAILNPGTSSCKTDGTADFQLAYYGESIDFEKTIVTVLKRSSGQEYDIAGNWIIEDKFLSNDTEQAYPRFSTGRNFTGKGTYTISFLVGKEKASFTITCPGVECDSSPSCEEDDFCNPEGFCEGLTCGECMVAAKHSCQEKCEDNNICTKDTCLDGICQNRQVENCCLTDKNCNDALICTKDICMNYRCTYQEVSCQAKDECAVASCKEFIGCASEANQTCIKEKHKLKEFVISSWFGKILKLLRLI